MNDTNVLSLETLKRAKKVLSRMSEPREYNPVILHPTLYDRAEREGWDMRNFVRERSA